MDCIEVCPVDCFYEGENMLVINPDECIDCSICEPECPAGAIYQTDDEEDQWFKINTLWSSKWPNITRKREADVPTDAEQWHGVQNKYEDYFSELPGKGD